MAMKKTQIPASIVRLMLVFPLGSSDSNLPRTQNMQYLSPDSQLLAEKHCLVKAVVAVQNRFEDDIGVRRENNDTSPPLQTSTPTMFLSDTAHSTCNYLGPLAWSNSLHAADDQLMDRA